VKLDLKETGWDLRCGQDSFGSGEATVVGLCEHGNELLGSIKGWKFLS